MTLDLHTAEPIPEAARAELERVLQSGDLFRYHAKSDAPVTVLEQEFAALLGKRFALAVSSCSAALFLTLRALDLPKGAKVLIPGFTFAAVPSAVVHADCVPVLVEVGENYRMDMVDFEAKLTDDIGAVIVSHMRGHTSDMDVIERLCNAKNIPIVEDAAHSLGTLWNGRKIGAIGAVGCFSFQSYKLVNGGEGGILVTDDEDIIARAVIMSGAYENNWQKHDCGADTFGKYQNMLPLYNTRLSNLSAVVIRPQLDELARRVHDGLRNHDHLAHMLNASDFIDVPPALEPETRAPDSIQFNLTGFSDTQAEAFMAACKSAGLGLSIFGLHTENARVFWNWKFLDDIPALPKTRAMLMRACDVRLPARLSLEQVELIGKIILDAVAHSRQEAAA
ncbi:aminotransferase DegT [Amylibacter marinus]|uniref:Aminotransferase DegT n=1 Tax=Amylibacter marinus TaxID=1475483 RepID=A0ABQ5VT54_9RHOB|nr:aminotransferase class I/II-fold pyridoxal phosphate-dependent enzyme [Amylibacter marinus]GLQ34613.1 aminotransferase DegT [Amylibacter marinus]